MMARTDRHCRYFMRLMSHRAMFYTEMISERAVLHGDRERLLAFDPAEQPLGVQFGGSEPRTLATCAAAALEHGYLELNLNAGCPSSRAGCAGIGARLMQDPERAADCVRALTSAGLPVSLKCRTGIDRKDDYDTLQYFIARCVEAGCSTVIVHAPKAWLQRLSPRQNRELPPLQYERVQRLKQDFPHVQIILNGGLSTPAQSLEQLRKVDGVMLGRSLYHRPALLLEVDRTFYARTPPCSGAQQVLDKFIPYVEEQLRQGVRLHAMLRHILGLFRDLPGGARWRHYLSTRGMRPDAGIEVLRDSRRLLHTATAARRPSFIPPGAAAVR